MTTRCRFSGDLKARVALEVLGGDMTVQEIAARHKVHPNQVSRWKCQAIAGLGEVFSVKRENASSQRDSEVHELYARIGQLTVERDFLANGLKR